METKLCRICGKFTESYANIFKTEGLKNKLETCLPIVVSQHCLLPDTICPECTESVEAFYGFTKNCLENLIILEAQYDTHESCLRSKRKFERGTCTMAELPPPKNECSTQTDEISFLKLYSEAINFPKTLEEVEKNLSNKQCVGCMSKSKPLVDYDLSDESDSGDVSGRLAAGGRDLNLDDFLANRQYFDNQENKLINRIAQRISLKRKSEEILSNATKMCKFDISSRRKNRQPKKIENVNTLNQWNSNVDKNLLLEENYSQSCLLCDTQFTGAALLAAHVFEIHGIDMAQVLSSEPVLEKKKRIPNLVKIADLKTKPEQQADEPVAAQPPSFACPICPAVPPNRTDLFNHLRIKHPKQSSLMCGLCLTVSNSYVALANHLETCRRNEPVTGKYVCKMCCYSDDAPKLVENHVIAHDFVLSFCRKQAKIFDPCDYVEVNAECDAAPKTYTCTECNSSGFEDFKEFSTHRRSQHQIFHCDLCNKFYGRNSHLWKHVNRLHKGHPSITCQLCHKTSASKYHLAQHFGKIHSAKIFNAKQDCSQEYDDFLKQKFQGFDFQSVKQSFLRQDLLEQEQKDLASDADASERDDENESNGAEKNDGDPRQEGGTSLPKEIDSSSNLYTNIITNYTPPQNNGEFKCQKCFKGFHKKNLLKKHKKNCRPRLQKDLLTRCKTCSRIFKDRQSLTKHLVNYHSEYACEICGQKFQSKCEIVSHIRFTHPSCHLFCSCGNILRNKADLVAHKSDHYNSFACQFCGDALPTKIKLKMHILSLHRKILSLSCGICLRLFETQHILRDHVRLVHKEHLLPLTSCTVCGKNYGSKWKTYDHLNKSHGRIFRACKACLEVFDSDEQLTDHYETMHSKFIQNKNVVNAPTAEGGASAGKADEYESDFEHENEEHTTNSNVSNDAYAHYQSKNNSRSDYEDVGSKTNFANMADENKISLLEKRLLGKKLSEETQQQQAKKNEKKLKNCDLRRDFDENESPLQNSSKRTVYVNSNDPSLCEICLKTWPAKKHLWQHYIRCHKTVAATVCGICLKANENYEALQKHLHETHPTLLHGQGFGSNFICRICGRYHNASSKLKLHMAIHENFDWSMLDTYEVKAQLADEKDPVDNGFDEPDVQTNEINYESLIEQVECSSEESEGMSDGEKSQDYDEDDDDNHEESSTSDDGTEDDNESDMSEEEEEAEEENSLESRMLRNMLIEKRILQQNNQNSFANIVYDEDDDEEEDEIKREATSSDTDESSEDSSSERDVVKAEVKSEVCSESDENENENENESRASVSDGSDESAPNMFERKPEELDSAIKSISYEQVNDEDEQVVEQFCEVQSQNLNAYEIQSAVDSIL